MNGPFITLVLALASVSQAVMAQAAPEGTATPKASPGAAASHKAARPAPQVPMRTDALDPKAINARTAPKHEAPAAVRTAPAGGASESCSHAKDSDA